MPDSNATIALSLLSAMITPALLISACGTLIFSTSSRLARIVDRVRMLARQVEELCARPEEDPVREQMVEIERQLATSAERTRLVQGSLTSFYVALGLFVATTVSIGATRLIGRVAAGGARRHRDTGALLGKRAAHPRDTPRPRLGAPRDGGRPRTLAARVLIILPTNDLHASSNLNDPSPSWLALPSSIAGAPPPLSPARGPEAGCVRYIRAGSAMPSSSQRPFRLR
jgi:hypothetical protein